MDGKKRRLLISVVLVFCLAAVVVFYVSIFILQQRRPGQPTAPSMRATDVTESVPIEERTTQDPDDGVDVANADAPVSNEEAIHREPRWVPVTEATDVDCDGKPDQDCFEYQYDAKGNGVRERHDEDCDGTPEKCTTIGYDERGRRISSRDFPNCKSDPVSCWSQSFGAGGEKTSWMVDEDCDGEPDAGFVTLSSDGRSLLRMYLHTDPPECSYTEFDDEGRISRSYQLPDCEGEPSACRRYSYEDHDEGTVEYIYVDVDCDGEPDKYTRRERDLDDRELVSEEYESGRIRLRRTTNYGENSTYTESVHDGNDRPKICVRSQKGENDGTWFTWTDEECDGIPDSCRAVKYGTHGEETGRYDDRDCDGTADANCVTRTYEYR